MSPGHLPPEKHKTTINNILGSETDLQKPENAITQLQETHPNHRNQLTEADIQPIPFFSKGTSLSKQYADFSFTYTKDRDGNWFEDTKRLYYEISKYGKIRIGRYEYRIGGRKNDLIHRILKE